MQVTRDAFLGGRLTLTQPKEGYRAGIDPVFLAAACPARAGQRVLELGCGVGAAALCLAWRTRAEVTGIERSEVYADLARENVAEATLPVAVLTADLLALPDPVRGETFDHVIANPPYFVPSRRSPSGNPLREAALAEETPLVDWLRVGAARLKPKGTLTLIQRAGRLHDILSGLPSSMGSVQVLPLAAREGRAAHLVLVQARKGGRAEFRLLAPFVLHRGAAHEADCDDYRLPARAILREGADLPFPK